MTADSVREHVQQSDPPLAQHREAYSARLDQWFAQSEARGGICAVRQKRVGGSTSHCAIYAVPHPKENESSVDAAQAQKLAQIQTRIDFAVGKVESAIANHEFEKARFYSDEEKKERNNLRLLLDHFNLEQPPPLTPLLCIDIIRDEHFTEVQKRCDDYITAGFTQVWLLAPDLKRAYTVTNADGLHEFRSEILQIENPPLEMDLRKIFD